MNLVHERERDDRQGLGGRVLRPKRFGPCFQGRRESRVLLALAWGTALLTVGAFVFQIWRIVTVLFLR